MAAAFRKPLARIYRLTARAPAPAADDPVEAEPGLEVPRFVLEWSQSGPDEARTFLDRLPSPVDVDGRSVLALGRGAGDLGVEVAHRGARRVMALEMAGARAELARARSARERGEGGSLPVEIRRHRGDPEGLPAGPFDVVLAAQAFRCYGADPASRHLETTIDRLFRVLEPGGLLGIGFGPFWKAPYGGSIDSRVPWAHLVFPEAVTFDEYRRVRAGSEAEGFSDIGINQVTLARFRRAMSESGFESVRVDTNVGESRAMRVARTLSRIRLLGEYFAQNVYGVWRRPVRAGGHA